MLGFIVNLLPPLKCVHLHSVITVQKHKSLSWWNWKEPRGKPRKILSSVERSRSCTSITRSSPPYFAAHHCHQLHPSHFSKCFWLPLQLPSLSCAPAHVHAMLCGTLITIYFAPQPYNHSHRYTNLTLRYAICIYGQKSATMHILQH